MSRIAIPTIGPSDASPCIDVFAVWAGYALDADASFDGSVQHLHILLDLTRTQGAWTCIHELSGLAADAIEFCASGLDIDGACHFLTYLCSRISPTNVNVVVGLPHFSQAKSAIACQLVDTVRQLQGASTVACVGVAEKPHSWMNGTGMEHFVGAPEPFVLRPSILAMFRIFAALSSPEALAEIDAADILAFMGPAQKPAHLVGVAWHLPGWDTADPTPEAGCMGAVSPHENECLFSAAAILACPLWSVSKQRRLASAVNTALVPFVPHDTPVTVATVDKFWSPQAAPFEVGQLALLCKAP